MHPNTHYEHLAKLLDYPRQDYPTWVASVHELLTGKYVIAAAHIEALAQALPTEGGPFTQEALDEIQEIHTRSFEVQSITTLGVGYVLFGDDYKRGDLLANLSREQSALGIDPGDELADHLPNVLRLLARWEDQDMVKELVEEVLHPALSIMVQEFDAHRTAQREEVYRKYFKTLIVTSPTRATIFRDPLQAILEVLKVDFDLGAYKGAQSPKGSPFLGHLERELRIEAKADRPQTAQRMK